MPYCSGACGGVFCPPGTACICDYVGSCGCGIGGGVGASCPVQAGQLCAPGLVCADEVCVQPGAVGEPCVFEFCVDEAFCTQDLLCEALRPPDEPCENAYECASWSCVDGLCAGPGDAGDPCAFPRQTCKPGLTCINGGTGGVCVVLVPPGGACTYFDECQGLAYCADGACVPTICEAL